MNKLLCGFVEHLFQQMGRDRFILSFSQDYLAIL